MLFRPNYCANCGVKVERPEWYPWTSRRFCTVCEVEYKGHEVLPKIAAVGLAVFGLFGISSLVSQPSPDLRVSRSEPRLSTPIASLKAEAPVNKVVSAPEDVNVQPARTEVSSIVGRNTVQAAKPKAESEVPVSFCGAETRKGTPCSRRVKGNTRCFQHLGMPAMSASESSEARNKRQIEPNK